MTKTVLITGCSSGFGKLAAKTFQAQGWNVVATMRTPENETELTQLENVLVTRLDVTDPASIAAALAAGEARFGGLHALINNAAYGGHALFEQMPDDRVRAMYETNVFGVMAVTRAVLPRFRAQREGVVVNVTSMAGMFGIPNVSIYCSTKYAIEGWTEALAHEYRPFNVRFTTVAPGAFETRFIANCENHVEQGDAELITYAQQMVAHIQGLITQLRPPGAPPADPQEVADLIVTCSTKADAPVHNPVGVDAQILATQMGSMPRQAFIEQLGPTLVPELQPQG